jgi:hypothetical protein
MADIALKRRRASLDFSPYYGTSSCPAELAAPGSRPVEASFATHCLFERRGIE